MKFKIKGVYIIKILLICFVIFAISQIHNNVSAVENNWSWTADSPVVLDKKPAAVMSIGGCSGIYQTIEIDKVGYRKACVSGSEMRYGTYQNDSSRIESLVGFPNDNKMYQLFGICSGSKRCIYVPERDMLITKQYIPNTSVLNLYIYKNFSKRIYKIIEASPLLNSYGLDTSNPDFEFKNINNYRWMVESLKASDNGRWLAIEIRDLGFAVMDLQDFSVKRLTKDSPAYDIGRNPEIEMDISDSGEVLAVGGQNAGLRIFENNSDCGEVINSQTLSLYANVLKTCKNSFVNYLQFTSNFRDAFRPKLNSDGGELHFYASSYVTGIVEVTLKAASYNSKRLDYLALGDSYSSGEGESDDSFYQYGTNDLFEKCHLSSRSYSYLLAQSMGIGQDMFKSVACSGAKMGDVVGKSLSYQGQGNRLGIDGLNFNKEQSDFVKIESLHNFHPGIIYQDEFVNKYKPKVITIGIGGNDAGFMEKLRSCISPGTCDWVESQDKLSQIATEIKGLFPKLITTYEKIIQDSPDSKIYAIGYPRIINPNGSCGLVIGSLLNQQERQFLVEGVVYINQVIKAAAEKVGIKYIDIESSFGDGALCGSETLESMNGIKFGDDESLIEELKFTKIIGQESFHPTPVGHQRITDKIISEVGNLAYFNNCLNGNICPTDVVLPEPSSYWSPTDNTQKPKLVQKDFVKSYDEPLSKNISFNENQFAPNTDIIVEIHSAPQVLGVFLTNYDGSLNVDVVLPDDIESGFHTIHVFGKSITGEDLDFYQTIQVLEEVINIPAPDENIVVDDTINPDINEDPVLNDGEAITRLPIINNVEETTNNQDNLTEDTPSNAVSISPKVDFGVSQIKNIGDKSDDKNKIATSLAVDEENNLGNVVSKNDDSSEVKGVKTENTNKSKLFDTKLILPVAALIVVLIILVVIFKIVKSKV